MALTTQRHVHVLTPDHHLTVLAGRAESETCVLLAQLAYSSQLLDLLALGDEGEDGGEGTPQERAL